MTDWPGDEDDIDFVTCVCRQMTAHPDNFDRCAESMPYDPRWHCPECLTDCGPCRDERAREWNDDHGIPNVKRH